MVLDNYNAEVESRDKTRAPMHPSDAYDVDPLVLRTQVIEQRAGIWEQALEVRECILMIMGECMRRILGGCMRGMTDSRERPQCATQNPNKTLTNP